MRKMSYLDSYQFDADMEREAARFSESLPMGALTSEADREYAYGLGEHRTDSAWVLSDRDCWYRNPSYRAPEYELRQSVAFDGVSFFGWSVINVATGKPATGNNHIDPLGAWKELRYLQELDALCASMHPEACGDVEPDDLESAAWARVHAAASPKPVEPAAPASYSHDDGFDEIPF
jgi:hypothetical protein